MTDRFEEIRSNSNLSKKEEPSTRIELAPELNDPKNSIFDTRLADSFDTNKVDSVTDDENIIIEESTDSTELSIDLIHGEFSSMRSYYDALVECGILEDEDHEYSEDIISVTTAIYNRCNSHGNPNLVPTDIDSSPQYIAALTKYYRKVFDLYEKNLDTEPEEEILETIKAPDYVANTRTTGPMSMIDKVKNFFGLNKESNNINSLVELESRLSIDGSDGYIKHLTFMRSTKNGVVHYVGLYNVFGYVDLLVTPKLKGSEQTDEEVEGVVLGAIVSNGKNIYLASLIKSDDGTNNGLVLIDNLICPLAVHNEATVYDDGTVTGGFVKSLVNINNVQFKSHQVTWKFSDNDDREFYYELRNINFFNFLGFKNMSFDITNTSNSPTVE